ncbi:MAG: hypothetical protein WDA13_00725 [Candidatus Shapirobacteria bacterium]
MDFIKPIYAQIINPALKDSESIVADPSTYVNSVIQSIFSVFFIVAVVYFIWHFVMAAYHMISSQGEPDKWKAAQKSILYSLVGIVLVFSIFAILKFVGIVTGVQGLQNLKLIWPSL